MWAGRKTLRVNVWAYSEAVPPTYCISRGNVIRVSVMQHVGLTSSNQSSTQRQEKLFNPPERGNTPFVWSQIPNVIWDDRIIDIAFLDSDCFKWCYIIQQRWKGGLSQHFFKLNAKVTFYSKILKTLWFKAKVHLTLTHIELKVLYQSIKGIWSYKQFKTTADQKEHTSALNYTWYFSYVPKVSCLIT